MKRVLVIGANSYIGKKFHEYVYSFNEKLIDVDLVSAADGSWEKVDFTLYDSVLHLSAIVHRKEKKAMKDLYEKVNHRLPVEIACKTKASHVKQFIFMSTAAVYGDINGCITKETVPKPASLYGKTKLAAEEDLLKLENENFKIAIIRAPMVYGEGCKGNYERLRKLAMCTPIFPDYHNKRSWVHIDRLNYNILEIIFNEGSGYYFPQDENYADTCEVVIGIRAKREKKTYTIRYFNKMIGYLKKRIKLINKLFGDLYYNKLDSI
ncbi:NAD-dependent epimerase/dehydratase family protein [Anaerocolumna xylanovorans]|uniref:UDP-glucose 4-epimerase n=1 Tax=Anaerocolumna xylanovorans DSM 12503 TaxID=1121345 RepID=A0A1M7Y4G2_9FIRM|nr:NAD-dependent epimerase/dehydratase family protein [Anaerocolumna xylanovorans]SHO47125.1 UDP-glucose 4-epimerase [Anaerocolumna xylanovorans DSM 12503]